MSKDSQQKLYKKITTEIRSELRQEDDISDEMLYDLAEGLLIDEAWMPGYLTSIGVSDHQGRVASDIG